MAEFKVIGKDWGNHVIELPDGSRRHVSDDELKKLQDGEDAPEATAEAEAEATPEESTTETVEETESPEATAEAAKPKTTSKSGK